MAETFMLKNMMHHLSIKTPAEKGKVIAFYSEQMGLRKVRQNINGEDLLIYFELADNLLLEVIIDRNCPKSGDYAGDSEGFVHFAFTVENLKPWVEKIQAENLKIIFGPAELPELKINTFLFRDPFGAVWEIMEDMK